MQGLEIRGYDELIHLLSEMGQAEKAHFALRDAMSQAVQWVERRAKDNLLANDSVASGNLRAHGVGSSVEQEPGAIIGIVYADARRNEYNYAEAVEFGAEPHWASLESLAEWVRIKHLAGTYSVRSRRRLGGKAVQRAEDESLARAVQVKIARYGIRARPFLLPALEDSRADVLRLFEQALDRMIDAAIGPR